MPPADVPTLEESTALLAARLDSLRLDLGPIQGITVAQLPPEVYDSLNTLAIETTGLRLVFIAAAQDIAGKLEAANKLADAQRELVENWGKAFADHPLRDNVDQIRWTLTRELRELTSATWNIASELGPVYASIEAMQWSLRGGLDGIARSISRMTRDLGAAVGDIHVTVEVDFPNRVPELLEGLAGIAKTLIPKPPEDEEGEPVDLASALVTAFGEMVFKTLAHPEGHSFNVLESYGVGSKKWLPALPTFLRPVADGMAAVGKAGAKAAVEAVLPAVSEVVEMCLRPFDALATRGVATPDTAKERVMVAYLQAVGLGLVAHGISGLSDISVFGCKLPGLKGAAAMIGRLAGFGPLASAVQGETYAAYLRTPLHYYLNERARPFLPSIGDVLRLKYKRIFARKAGDPGTAKAPYTFAECMAYYGYSDDWIRIYEDDLFREPMARDLLMMAEVGGFDDAWWAYKIQRLGYSDSDAPVMVEAFKRRSARTQILDLYRRLWYLASEGFISIDSFRERVKETKLCPMAIDFGAQSAEAELERQDKRDLLASAKQQYVTDAIDDDEFRNLVDRVYEDPQRAERVYTLERLKRYRRVYRMTPSDQVRRALPLYRRAFLASAITSGEYHANLIEAGLESEIAALTLQLDSAARDAAMWSAFQRFGLPALRDDVLHGFVSVPQYRSALRDAKFPEQFLDDEVALVVAQFERRQRATVRTGQLPAYRRAFVVGLVGAATLDGAFRDAGVDPDAIEAEHVVLDWQRETLQQRETERQTRERERELAGLKRQADRERKEMERAEKVREREAQRREREAEKARADAAREEAAKAKAAAAARRPGWPGDVARINRQMALAYKAADGILPDDVWELGQTLEDALASRPGPDPETVDSLCGRIEQSLARHAGVIPAPAET